MKVLYVTGSCLTKNTSANMSHNGYVQGLLENGADLDIIMSNDSFGDTDNKLQKYPNVRYFIFNAISFGDKLRQSLRRNTLSAQTSGTTTAIERDNKFTFFQAIKIKSIFRIFAKKVFYSIFKQHPIYPLDATWLKNASKFVSDTKYDLVISNSSPAASHKLVDILAKNGQISFCRWIQIWEDPWFQDLYGRYSEKIKSEEHDLLKSGQEIYYVSPLTTHYQKILYSDCSLKMDTIPLPYLALEMKDISLDEVSIGYFGDYYSHTRNLQPFYDAIKSMNYTCYIYGDSDLNLTCSKNIIISGRVTLDVLEQIQNKTSILVHLCNLKGGQIPGKIYHYSATNKPILFILDGTEYEKNIIKDYFSKYNRYYFCNNNITEIKHAIHQIAENYTKNCGQIVEEFSPRQVVKQLLFSN